MSRTTLWRVFRTTAAPEAEFRNSWGSAPPLWDMLGYRYLGLDAPATIAGDEAMSKLFRLARDARVPEHLRITLACTADLAFIPVASAEIAAVAFDATHADLLAEPPQYSRPLRSPMPPPTWSHWPAIASALRAGRPRPRTLGWGIGCTSVSDPWERHRQKSTGDPFDAISYARSVSSLAA